ncbi:1-phosphofructokinase family hexose kinase [Pseudorhodobacter sp.]|uniref:1-phosphofructokinase family hexose kinase n=1 Tax=Pseudorhodobacter sp. TaxID=1934400 RepID=UPI002AFE9DBC|nr:1-phosphofructokinase family hexose kinase [Pseudorhodobacter sp.]
MTKSQTAILTVTLNPALDLSTATAVVRAGPKLRCDMPRYDPGGGGINISRAIAALGGETTAIVALGGATGAQLSRLLADGGIISKALPAPGETRLSVSVTETGSLAQYRFVLPGPVWTEADVHAAMEAIVKAVVPEGIVVISGSQPPGVPSDFIAQLGVALPASARLIADTSGAPLLALVGAGAARLDTLRMDAEEAETVAQMPLASRKDSADFAQSLVRRGVANRVIIARGPDGSVMATESARWFSAAAKVPVKSKIGAGDSFVAGFVLALARGQTEAEALAYGVAAASAAVMTPATELCRRSDTEALVSACPVSTI